MEVFISNLDPQATTDKVERWLKPILNKVNVHIYDLRKLSGKPYAKLTIADTIKAQALLSETSGMTELLPCHPRSKQPAKFRISRYEPDAMLVKVLRKEEKEFGSRNHLPKFNSGRKGSTGLSEKEMQHLKVRSIRCGRWEIQNAHRVFVSYFNLDVQGSVEGSSRALLVKGNCTSLPSAFTIFFDHSNIQSFAIPNAESSDRLMITLSLSPKVYSGPRIATIPSSIQSILSALTLDNESAVVRYGVLPQASELVAGSCLVYQINFRSKFKTKTLRNSLEALSSRQIPIWLEDIRSAREPVASFLEQVTELEEASERHRFSFPIRFQLQALWTNADLSPGEVQRLLPILASMKKRGVDDRDLAATLRFVHSQLPIIGPGYSVTEAGIDRACAMLSSSTNLINPDHEVVRPDEILVHRVTVTPAGTYLYGPDKETPNRVIRRHKKYDNHFIRVTFADESGDRVQFDSEASNEHIFRSRFLGVLQQGLRIAGKHFSFLGFSHSSLRSQTCWFMRPFVSQGARLTAQSVIASLGDFSHIQNPAKCAARIGQAFSDTQRIVSVRDDEVRKIPDIKRGEFTFTDGCGTISKALWARITHHSDALPTAFQIRYAGAKGMLSLNSSLSGCEMRLRPSMIKFISSSTDIEICGTNARPLPFRLNRQIVKILEDLKIKDSVFETVQGHAVENLRRSARSVQSATDFLCSRMVDHPTGIGQVVRMLAAEGIDATEDQFIRVVVRGLIEVQLREIKFRTRIPVNHAVTLYGICDETGFLKEGQVYVTFETQTERYASLQGRVLVTRSPALHPGDVQLATAVKAPPGSPLTDLTNCIVFSQMGTRDLPSMLAGGDLDGDLFGVIYDSDLIPDQIATPANYSAATATDIGRSVTSEDMTRFFIDFMQNDQLGRIANLHQVYADKEVGGTYSSTCLQLAELHSIAVDFSKSGVPVDTKKIPKSPECRPDFMAPSTSTKVHRGIKDAEEAVTVDSEGPQRYRYYESDRILGKLYRSINEDGFFEDLQDDDVSIFSRDGTDHTMSQVWSFVQRLHSDRTWENYLVTAQEVKEYYDTTMSDIMSTYAIENTYRLTEQEVLIGAIIGRPGAGNHRQREQAEMMKMRYKREVQDLRQWMKSHTHGDRDAYLALSVACLSLCTVTDAPVETENSRHRRRGYSKDNSGNGGGSLRSFGWFAAAICVPRLLERARSVDGSLDSLSVHDDRLP